MANVRSGTMNESAYIDGSLSVTSAHGHEYGPFDVRVKYPDSFPEPGRTPDVSLRSHRNTWRTGGDSHIEKDWRLCLFVPLEADIDFRDPRSLDSLLAVTRLFLAKQEFYQLALLRHEFLGRANPVWPGTDRAHGIRGIRDAIAASGPLRANDRCACGSGRKFKRCHGLLPRTEDSR